MNLFHRKQPKNKDTHVDVASVDDQIASLRIRQAINTHRVQTILDEVRRVEDVTGEIIPGETS